jgi:triphosphoribosyl-dephospho-CoA synthase
MTPEQLSRAVTAACILEASAPKPGNVSPGRPFANMAYEDFVASAVAIGPPLGAAGERSLGETILAAVEATRSVAGANTNLGIVLLLAPLAKAVRHLDNAGAGAPASVLRASLASVLGGTTVADARLAYRAISLARPSGLGDVPEQDVRSAPTVTLRSAMALAADRDLVAREYTTDYVLTFELLLPVIRRARAAGMEWDATVVEAYLTLLAREPDTLIARKVGMAEAEAVSAEARAILAVGDLGTAAARGRLAAFDARLRDSENSRNPGTTADLTAAAIFVALIEAGGTGNDSRIPRAQ